MIEKADFYKTNKPTIANSKDFDLSLNDKSFFPEGIYIGELESVTGHKAPALIPIHQTNGICFLTHTENRELIHKTMQAIALRLLLALPTGLCKFTLYDGTGLGTNLIALSNISSKIKGENILTDSDELKRALNAAKSEIPNIIQKVLGQKFLGKTLIDYNKEAGELAKPYHFIFITDYPNSFSKEQAESLEKIIRSGKQAGVFVLMSLDTSYQVKSSFDNNPMPILDSITTIYESNDTYYIKNIPDSKYFNQIFKLTLNEEFPDYEIIEAIQDEINNALKEVKKVEVDITSKLTQLNLWKSNGSLGIEVPIGKLNSTDLQNFTLSLEDGNSDNPHHCLIGGATGSGKTVLLHNIICNTAWLYSPEEVQFILLDYKEGTEFKVYENLPHVKVLSIRSEREYGVSVFEYLSNEIEKRGEFFKSRNVASITKYNDVSNEKLPRILVVIDEFQKLLDGDAKTTNFISNSLDDIGRRGRSFGINLILSTQSLGGININQALSHLGLRISLRLNTTKDCDQLLGSMNHIPFTALTKKGEAVYNSRGGLTEGNVRFQTAYLSDSKLTYFINSIKTEVVNKYNSDSIFKRFLYDGSTSASIQDNKNIIAEIDNLKCKVFIGEPAALFETHTHYILRRQNESNVLIVGQDTASAVSLLNHSLSQIMRQSTKDSKFYLIEKISVDSEFYGRHDNLLNQFDNFFIVENEQKIESLINEVYVILEERKKGSNDKSRVVLGFSDIYNIRNLRKNGFNPSPIAQKLLSILKDGPSNSIHLIIYANSYNNYSSIFEPLQTLNEFEIKIELRNGDGYKIFGGTNLDTQKATPTSNNIGNLKTPQLNQIQKFKTYSL
jgi:DNA segregation ATPase FtsK/SpoIIIE, S-DNA-T family